MEILETSDVRESISTAISGFRVVKIPELPRVILDSFDTLPVDPSSKQQYRRRATWFVTDGNGVRMRSPMARYHLHNRSDDSSDVQISNAPMALAEIEIDVSKIINLMLDVIHVRDVSRLRASVRQVRMVVDRVHSKVNPSFGWNPTSIASAPSGWCVGVTLQAGEISIKCEETDEIDRHPVFRARQGIVLDRGPFPHAHGGPVSIRGGHGVLRPPHLRT
ncbi:hypothetical protein [Paraburkholderia terrae]|uniref:hypothetical protein n=1 Tax=Paraburkholderia terrae TaxID=311230 RepID=UPI0012DFFBD7|nr:hypothetical protein [Paraburkholderia terrae]